MDSFARRQGRIKETKLASAVTARDWRPLQRFFAALATAALVGGCNAAAQHAPTSTGSPASAATSTFITLGTFAGQAPSPVRAQPSNLLRYGGEGILVDAGDGVSGQLAKAGVSLGAVRSVFISHLHYDHTGGLFGFMGLRRRSNTDQLTIYGPPGTQQLVEGLVAAMAPNEELTRTSRGGSPGAAAAAPRVNVVELKDGSVVTLNGARVVVATNSHYSFAPESEEAKRFLALSFRFELPDRTIVYTGDTGPSENVERLARDADLLVAEISDPDGLISAARKAGRVFTPEALKAFDHHMRIEHLTPEDVGQLAAKAQVKHVVITHIGLGDRTVEQTLPRVQAHYSGAVTFANDLDRF